MANGIDQTHPCSVCGHPAKAKCAGCKKVHYCSKECQKDAWLKHKGLCKIHQLDNPPDPDSYCGLCGAQEHLTRTGCCNRPICDDVHKYKPMSYSLVSCYRNHERYTVCAYHKKEGHDGNDWRQCAACRTSFADTLELFAGQGTSHHNFADDKWKAPTFEPTCCWKCGRVIKLNSEGYTNHTRCGVKECSDCDFVPKNQIRHSLVCCHGM